MGRASKIYVVEAWMEYEGSETIAAFTVKHELVAWLKSQRDNIPMNREYSGWEVKVVPDGTGKQPYESGVFTVLKAEELIE